MSILDELKNREVWENFLIHKQRNHQLTKRECMRMEAFINARAYLPVVETMSFGYPVKKQIAKDSTSRKRTVYMYPEAETMVLKLIAYLLYRYDDRMPDHCYSFRQGRTAKTALDAIKRIPGLEQCFVLKADISNYFNSIDIDILIPVLQVILSDDPELLAFMETLLRQDRCYENGVLTEEKRGVMAGVPLASFFANVYLISLDQLFESKDIPCFRYSDDILIFTKTDEECRNAYALLEEHLKEKHLMLNPEKVSVSSPGEPWEFLGFRYDRGTVDLSEHAIEKMKAKIRRKAHKLYRWRKKNGADYDRAAKAMIRSFDSLFYDISGSGDFTWTRFYFPLITSSAGLHRIDEYMVMYLRYLYSGRHTKSNYRITYDHLKQLGYTPLVAEYYRWKEENRKLNAQQQND